MPSLKPGNSEIDGSITNRQVYTDLYSKTSSKKLEEDGNFFCLRKVFQKTKDTPKQVAQYM